MACIKYLIISQQRGTIGLRVSFANRWVRFRLSQAEHGMENLCVLVSVAALYFVLCRTPQVPSVSPQTGKRSLSSVFPSEGTIIPVYFTGEGTFEG